jgi:hypothetical protein
MVKPGCDVLAYPRTACRLKTGAALQVIAHLRHGLLSIPSIR